MQREKLYDIHRSITDFKSTNPAETPLRKLH